MNDKIFNSHYFLCVIQRSLGCEVKRFLGVIPRVFSVTLLPSLQYTSCPASMGGRSGVVGLGEKGSTWLNFYAMVKRVT